MILVSIKSDIAGSVLSKDVIVCPSWEGTDSKQEDVEDETQAEHVTDGVIFGLHVLDIDDFRSHISRSTTSDEEILFSVGELCKSEISNDTFAPAVF